ncbi:MAG TPA: ADP-glyceromanno-heptose 6-epimerase [Tepidisphaeraceae bacterium]|nr:ADP-glyceromanno-heptose 6-epimerase [Tepidisphaeraceae bacterium]
MSKPIIVTGAAGFIGRNVVAELNRRGHENLLLVDFLGKDEKWKNLIGLRFNDIIDPDTFFNSIEQKTAQPVDAIIHLGACSSTTERDADFLLRNNYRYTRVLCEWSLQNKARFVYASSAATYGDGSRGYSDKDEITPTLAPLNMYGFSKQLFDLWALSHGVVDKVVGLKYFNVYGPYEDHKGDQRSVVHKAYQQIASAGSVKLFKSYHREFADGEQKRDFVYVRDAVEVTLHFALDRRNVGGIFNVGTGEARSWNDLARAVFSALGKKPKIEYIDMPEILREKYQYFTQADVNKLRSQGGYAKPFTSLEVGVADYVSSYLSQTN